MYNYFYLGLVISRKFEAGLKQLLPRLTDKCIDLTRSRSVDRGNWSWQLHMLLDKYLKHSDEFHEVRNKMYKYYYNTTNKHTVYRCFDLHLTSGF